MSEHRFTAQLVDPLDTAYGMSVLMVATSEEEASTWARTIARTCKTAEGRTHALAEFYPTSPAHPGADPISRESIIEALRDAHRNDSAADAVEFVSDLVGWSAEDDPELQEGD